MATQHDDARDPQSSPAPAAKAAPKPSPPPRRGRPPTKPRPQLSPLVAHLVRWRQERDLTHEAIAKLLGISVNTYKSYEWGNRQPGGPSTLKIIRLTGYPV